VVADLLPVLGHMPAWLVSRRVRPEYYLDPAIREVIETRFERLIWTETPPEPLRALRVCQMELPPILLGPPMLARDEARRRLGMGGARPLLLGLGSGEAGPQARLARVLGKIAVRVGADLRFVSAELPAGDTVVDGFPAVSLLRAADAVVAASGYHAFHELTALGAPAVFVPQQRRFDDQVWRARDAETATDPPGLEAAVRRLLFRGWQAPRADGDGAARLARLVQRRVEAGVLTEEEIAAVA
jgi:UDP:flavonoid glycosyltransferase YjiC (YdhE family)